MTVFNFLTSVSWKGRPQLLSVDTSPAVGTSIMASEPLGETSPMVRLLAGTSHCANLAWKQIDVCQLEPFSTCSPSSKSSRQTGQVASSPLFTLLLTTQPSTWGWNCLIWKTTNTNTKINQKTKQNTNIKIDKKYKYKDQPPLLSSLLLLTTPTRTSAPWSPSKKRQLIQFQFKQDHDCGHSLYFYKNVSVTFSKWGNLPNQSFLTSMYYYRS